MNDEFCCSLIGEAKPISELQTPDEMILYRKKTPEVFFTDFFSLYIQQKNIFSS